jgi:RNA polymerase sigma factor (sigma-70 family)
MSARNDLIEQVYLRWRLPLLKILRRRLDNDADAEDLMQDSFARWTASKGEGRPENPRAYVTRIALNAVYESAHKRHRELGLVVPLDDCDAEPHVRVPSELACPERQLENRQMLDRIQQALQELPERQREVFTLHRFDGLSYEEIAAAMQISRALVSRYISQTVAYCRLRVHYPSQQAMRMAISSEDSTHEA